MVRQEEGGHRLSATQSDTIWEKLGAAEGLWAAALLGISSFLATGAGADLAGGDSAFVVALTSSRMTWEWVTFLRLVGGLMVVWWMGSLAGRLRLAEGEPGRLSSIAFGVGVLWGAVWLLSAFLNSAAILLATDYANPAGARVAGTLAQESAYVLTPSITFVLMLATALVTMRFGGFARWYAMVTTAAAALMLVLAIADWYGTGGLSVAILWVGLLWMALTSALLIPTYVAPDAVHGLRRAPG